MNIIIKNAEIFTPNFIGKKDIVILRDKIVYIGEKINKNFNLNFLNFKTIDAKGKYIVPGFIDSHQHFLGGGGEGGFRTRTPAIRLTDITKGGVTTAVGCLGTDSVTRNLRSLLAKSKALEKEGISTYMYTGSYRIPPNTITEGVREDIVLIDKIIGTGEVALEDHRSSQPTYEEFKKVVAETSIGGMLAGKAGIVNIHMGDGKNGLGYLYKIIEEGILSPKNILPTHINRSQVLLEQGRDYAKIGGLIDLTTSSSNQDQDKNECAESLNYLFNEDVPIENITLSSDAQGSLPKFDQNGKMTGMRIGQVTSLYETVKSAVKDFEIDLSKALKVITSNPARIFGLENKGKLVENYDADLVILDKEDLTIETVIAKGNIMIEDKKAVVKGTFQ